MPTIEDYRALSYPIIVKESTYTDGSPCYEAEHPDLPGCMGQGNSVPEAIEDLRHSRYLYIESLIEDGLPIPTPSDPLPATFEVNVSIASTSRTQTNIVIVDVSTRDNESDAMDPTALIFPEPIKCGQLESKISMM